MLTSFDGMVLLLVRAMAADWQVEEGWKVTDEEGERVPFDRLDDLLSSAEFFGVLPRGVEA